MLYMIQRCTFKPGVDATEGVDANLSMDYMGSSEFELGALPASLRRICKLLDEYGYYQHPTLRLGKNPLVIFCRDEVAEEVFKELVELDKGTIRPRPMECTYFDQRNDKYLGKAFSDMVWWNLDERGGDLFFSYNPRIRNIKTMICRSIERMNAKKGVSA